jgi:hypothetical protein
LNHSRGARHKFLGCLFDENTGPIWITDDPVATSEEQREREGRDPDRDLALDRARGMALTRVEPVAGFSTAPWR